MSNTPDYIVVGSGPTGAMAAQTLVEAGKQVVMIDVGATDTHHYGDAIPEKDFATIRRTDPDQYKYLIGEEFEGIAWGTVGKGEQITPPRKHMVKLVEKLIPVISDQFSPYESLGYGGLGVGWGIGCWEWSNAELAAAGMDPKQMSRAYNKVCERIGISATDDDASMHTIGNLKGYQKSPDMDRNHQLILKKYLSQAPRLTKKGFSMGRAPLALLTQSMGDRKQYAYKDMDFYSDKDQSAYRPWITINELRKASNFSYLDQLLVVAYEEKSDHVRVICLDTRTNKRTTHTAKRLILASGVLGTARIVLRSSKTPGQKLPILCNPYSYIPCLQPAFVGKEVERHKLGFAQLSFFLDEDGQNKDVAMASLYSYQSLMLFRMIRQMPLNFVDSRILLRYLSSGIVIMGIHQPDTPSDQKYIRLRDAANSPTKDALEIMYTSSPEEQVTRSRREKAYVKAMRSMGVYALKRIDPGMGSSIHYAGSLPFSAVETPYTLSPDGRLHGTKKVFVADGSGFRFLPAKGLTFSLMANACLVAEKALNS